MSPIVETRYQSDIQSVVSLGNNRRKHIDHRAAPSKAARTYNVCGSVPGGADVAVGAHADTVIATVTF